jgi:uncharacterized protein
MTVAGYKDPPDETPDESPEGQTPFEPVPEDAQRVLLRYSRLLLRYELDRRGEGIGGDEPPPPAGYAVLDEPFGFFVTLRRGGNLRGCIGSITTEDPLVHSIRRRTLDAAFHDPRFSALQREELSGITIEHSVLSTPREEARTDAIRLEDHGVILQVGTARSVFLPEVALEQGWDLVTTLRALARKAGLKEDAWRRPEARISTFRTQHYREERRVDHD